MSNPPTQVAVGILRQPDGQLLLTSRPADKPWPYWWELPGGKIEPGETPLAAVARELQEELGIDIDPQHSQHWVTTTYHYPKGPVQLSFFIITRWSGSPLGLEGQTLAWVQPQQLGAIGPILPATLPILRWLRLPPRYLISSAYAAGTQWLPRLGQMLAQGQPLMVQFREPEWQQQAQQDPQAAQALLACFQATLALCRRHQAPCLVNSAHPQSWWAQADGVHLRSHEARYLDDAPVTGSLHALHAHFGLPSPHLFGISAHDEAELQRAARLQADFAVLGHVLPTPSHPGSPHLGWDRFAELSQQITLPVYAIGGQHEGLLATAQSHGAHGIAGMRQLLSVNL